MGKFHLLTTPDEGRHYLRWVTDYVWSGLVVETRVSSVILRGSPMTTPWPCHPVSSGSPVGPTLNVNLRFCASLDPHVPVFVFVSFWSPLDLCRGYGL